MSVSNDIAIDAGDTWTSTIIWKDSSGAARPLTGYSARMQLRKAPGSTEAAVSLTESDGITITEADGRLDILISAARTSALTGGNYVYAVEVESPVGIVTTLVKGTATVNPEVIQ